MNVQKSKKLKSTNTTHIIKTSHDKAKPKSDVQKNIQKEKIKYAKKLSSIHANLEDTISGIAYIQSGSEENPDEPIKLLEINSATAPSGFFPVVFGPSEKIPYKSTLVELTPKEAQELEKGNLRDWPKDWQIGEWIYKKNKGHNNKG